MANDTSCLCRVLQDRDGNPYIAQEEHCPVHNPQMPRCEDMSSREFAAYTGKSVATVCRWARSGHEAARWCPYRREYRWLPYVYRKALEKSTVKPGQPGKKQPGPRARYAVVKGGRA